MICQPYKTTGIFLVFSTLIFSCEGLSKADAKVGNEQCMELITKKEMVFDSSQSNLSKLKIYKTLNLLQDQLQIEIPLQLEPMELKIFQLKYPMENPENTMAFSNEDGTVSMLISPRQERAKQADLPKYKKLLFESFGNNPLIDFKKMEFKKINDRDFILIEMITPAADTRVYNKMFVTTSNGYLLMGTFNCTVSHQNEWRPIADRIISSVKVKNSVPAESPGARGKREAGTLTAE